MIQHGETYQILYLNCGRIAAIGAGRIADNDNIERSVFELLITHLLYLGISGAYTTFDMNSGCAA